MQIIGFENFRFNLCEVILNNSCPLDCHYCFLENRGEAENMSVETLQNVLRMCKQAQEVNPQEYISVMFALKEPMVSWKTITKALETLEFDPMDHKIFLVMNTNGVLLTPEILAYGRRKGIDFHISLDGPKDIHDRDRVYRGNKSGSSWEKVMEVLYSNSDTQTLSCMTTVQVQDIDRIEEICEFMCDLPISCWVYALNKFEDWTDERLQRLEKGLKRFIDRATPAQLAKMRIQNTAAAFPNINVINGVKVEQDGTVVLQPPTPNDGAKEGAFTSRVFLGNVNDTVEIPEKYRNINYQNYRIIGPDCKEDCPLRPFCLQGTEPIYVSDFSCRRVQHFDRMATYAKGGNMTDKEYQKVRDTYPIFSAVINVTDQCNLRCPYCFTEHNTRVIDMGTMKAAIMFILSECDRFEDFHGQPNFAFFGGEPMLHFEDIIKPTVLWLEESGLREKYNITLNMTTNGTLFTEENIKFLAEHEVFILLSIDGDKETQDDQRPGANGASSFDMINIPLILKYFPQVTFRSAIEPRNADKMLQNYLFARNSGFLNYFITPNLEAEWSDEAIKTAMEQLAAISEVMYLDIARGVFPLKWNEFLVQIKSIFLPLEGTESTFNRCGIGTNTVGIAANGDLNGCQEHNTYVEHDIFHIGNVFTGIDPVKHKRLLSAYKEASHPICVEEPNRCNTCEFYDDCAHHFCPSHNLNNGNLISNSRVNCIWKSFCKRLALLWLARAEEENNPNVMEFLEAVVTEGVSNYSNW